MSVSLPAWASQILIYHCLFVVVLNKISKHSASAVDVPCASLDSYEYMKSCKYFSIYIFLTQIEKHENIWLTVDTIRFTSYLLFLFTTYLYFGANARFSCWKLIYKVCLWFTQLWQKSKLLLCRINYSSHCHGPWVRLCFVKEVVLYFCTSVQRKKWCGSFEISFAVIYFCLSYFLFFHNISN